MLFRRTKYIFRLTFGVGCVILIEMMENFVRFREVLTPSGVYVLLRQERVVYVGKSKNIFSRLAKHYMNQQRVLRGLPAYNREREGPVIRFDDVRVKFCAVDVLDREEVKLIQQYLPQHNTHHVVPRYDLSRIPAFREMLERARAKRGDTVDRRRGFGPRVLA
jgi:excinuclease UvrABC nuclease subunit